MLEKYNNLKTLQDKITEENQKEIADKDKKIQEKNDTIKQQDRRIKTLENLEKRYNNIDEIYEMYLMLGDEIHKNLSRILNSENEPCSNVEVFLGYGIQENNICAFWDDIAIRYDRYLEMGKIDDLKKIFLYFLYTYKNICFKNIDIFEPVIGEEFDERFHSRISNGKVAGKINKIILPGFAIGKSINKKPLVYVE